MNTQQQKSLKVLLMGDACVDVYHYGVCARLSPEAPVPVFQEIETEIRPGMALNVYNNLKSLGVDSKILHGKEKVEKIRYVDEATNHLFIRIDTDNNRTARIDQEYLTKEYLLNYDAIVISDYDKGFLTKEDIEKICYRHPLTFMDTKKSLGRWCKDCKWIKINENEFERTRENISGLEHIFGEKLIVTMGERGCCYSGKMYPVEKVEIKDLSGAGDTFLSGFIHKYLTTF